jgi:hypothetical protein
MHGCVQRRYEVNLNFKIAQQPDVRSRNCYIPWPAPGFMTVTVIR